jgi:hypothetical protein
MHALFGFRLAVTKGTQHDVLFIKTTDHSLAPLTGTISCLVWLVYARGQIASPYIDDRWAFGVGLKL